MKEFDGINGIWTYNHVPEKDEHVLISDGPYQDFPNDKGRSKNLDELIKKAEQMKSGIWSSLRIYNDQKKIVWDAFCPTTLSPNHEEYDPEYLKKICRSRQEN